MRISSTDVIEGGRVLYTIGKIKAASAWHAANGAPPQANWRELVVSELIRKAEDIDADAIIGLDYETDSILPIEGTGLQVERIILAESKESGHSAMRASAVLFCATANHVARAQQAQTSSQEGWLRTCRSLRAMAAVLMYLR